MTVVDTRTSRFPAENSLSTCAFSSAGCAPHVNPESWCFLLAAENERLRILTQTNDGFIVAQKDLELRGPGDLMGTRQSGEMMADFLLDGDVRLLDEAAKCMKRLREDPKLAAERQQVEAEALRNYRDKLADIAMN